MDPVPVLLAELCGTVTNGTLKGSSFTRARSVLPVKNGAESNVVVFCVRRLWEA